MKPIQIVALLAALAGVVLMFAYLGGWILERRLIEQRESGWREYNLSVKSQEAARLPR